MLSGSARSIAALVLVTAHVCSSKVSQRRAGTTPNAFALLQILECADIIKRTIMSFDSS